MERNEVEAFFLNGKNSLVVIETTDSRTFIGYIHGWENYPYDDWIYFQEDNGDSGRMPRSIIKSIKWYHDKI